MANVIATVSDLVERITDYLGDNPGGKATRDVKRAISDAYREIATAHNWTYLYKEAKVLTTAPYSTGTLAYTHSGGAYPRLVTLTGGVWPEWADLGMLIIGSSTYELVTVLTNTTAQLDINSNPGADLAALTTYTLMRDSYPLPPDFTTSDRFVTTGGMLSPSYVRPGEWMRSRTVMPQTGTPSAFTIMGDDRYMGTLAFCLHPAPQEAQQYETIYQRKMRQLAVWDYRAGTATTSINSSALVGTGTAWTDRMIGSVVRVSGDATDYPTAPEGANPARYERTIMTVSDATHLTVDLPYPETLTGVKHTISDPLDVQDGNMLNALVACAQMHVSFGREKKDQAVTVQRYQRALILAKEADSPVSLMRRRAGVSASYARSVGDYDTAGPTA